MLGISLLDILDEIKVSKATLKNWIKTGLLVETDQGYITQDSFNYLKQHIIGKTKLTTRANKLYYTPAIESENTSFKDHETDKLQFSYEDSLPVSHKNKYGIYYTPPHIVSSIFDSLENITQISNLTFCDPCCGTGNFLIEALDRGISVDNIYGFDIDTQAIEIAKQRIYEKTGVIPKNIYCRNFLTQEIEFKFNIIATNPPWGQKLQYNNDKEDSSAIFMRRALDTITDGGAISMLLPSAFNNIARFQGIRYKLLSYTIKEIKNYQKPFKGILEQAHNIIIQKKTVSQDNIILCSDKEVLERSQSEFTKNPNFVFNFHISSEEYQIIDYLFSIPHITLKENANWALGIVTGNNAKYLTKEYSPNLLPIFRGTHIKQGTILETNEYITPNFSSMQQVAPLELYDSPKLVYSFISNQLNFAYDKSGKYFLNSANMIIPNKDFPVPIAAISFLFNTDIVNWIFSSIFNAHKILQKDLEYLPIWIDFFEKNPQYSESLLLKYLKLEEKNGSYQFTR